MKNNRHCRNISVFAFIATVRALVMYVQVRRLNLRTFLHFPLYFVYDRLL
jgi:hypothetical protein